MSLVGSPKAAADPNLAPPKQAPAAPSVAAEAAERRMAEHRSTLRGKLEPNKLQVLLDGNAQRFVQTLTDSKSGELLRRYPSEAQLAYARAVMAYLRAQTES
jgi:hypothetical protein